MEPEAPLVATPVDNNIAPLAPVSPTLAVVMESPPLDADVLLPLCTTMLPPVDVELLPLFNKMEPPTASPVESPTERTISPL